MVKKRVYELAKELNIENKEIIRRLVALGVPVKSHSSTVGEEDVERLQELLKKEREKTVEAKKEVKKAPPSQAGVPGNGVSGQAAVPPAKAAPAPSPEKGGAPAKKGADRPKTEIPGAGKGQESWTGLVDRVPSRPPDRRFLERPFTKGDIFPGGLAKAPLSGEAAPKAAVSKPAVQSSPPASPPPAPKPAPPPPPPPPPALKAQQPAEARRPAEARPLPPPAPKPSGRAEQAQAPRKHPAPGSRPPGRDAQGAPKPGFGKKPFAQGQARGEPLKVPKAPVTGEKQAEKPKTVEKPKKEKERYERGREWREAEERVVERKLRFIPGGKRKREEARPKEPAPAAEKKPVPIGETVTVQELAAKMKVGAAEVIKKLMALGVLATINQEIDYETATIVAAEFGYEVQVKFAVDEETLLGQDAEDDPSQLQPRPCVVTVMGHVDHGKTSLLDAIRQTNVTATEVGGITQHIGAYQVEHNNKKITFIDTPGHEAFTAMRARGASVTDIAVLVVAADDGVMPQTVEAINHAKAAGTPIIVAINKIDKPEADAERVKRQLTEYELVPEEWGGQTICVPVSAKTKQGLKDLLEMILLVAEISDLKANPNRPARGTIIEAELDKGRGPVATVLVQNGTLNVGDYVLAGTSVGRVRAMNDHLGRRLKSAGPSTPVEVLGFSEVPRAGDILYAVADEKLARQIAAKRALRKKEEEAKTASLRVSLDDLFRQIKEGQVKELNIVLKADVQGSVEALKKALEALSTAEVRVNIIHSGVGLISETDVLLASASNAIILGFNVKPDINARRAAEVEKVDIRTYRVIYDAINDVKAAMSGLLEPEYREVVIGHAEVRKIFKISRLGTIAGCYVKEGKLTRDARVRLLRDGKVVYEGKLDSLKRFKDDVREVQEGYECGLALENFNDIQEGDIIEAATTEVVKRELA
ncbi:MAG: translation initiation factor IF-2 [Desulfotomaculales bacterium]